MAQQHLIRVMMSQEPSGSQGKPDPEQLQRKKEMKRMTDAYIKDEKDEKTGWKKANDFMRKNLGINFGVSAILKQSQIFTSFIGTIFQLMGALVDVMLYAFIPILLPIIRGIGWLIPKIHEVMSKHVAPLIQNLMDATAGIFKWVGNFMANPSWELLGKGIGDALAAVVDGWNPFSDNKNNGGGDGLPPTIAVSEFRYPQYNVPTGLLGVDREFIPALVRKESRRLIASGIHATARAGTRVGVGTAKALTPTIIKSLAGIVKGGMSQADVMLELESGVGATPSLKNRVYDRSRQLSKQFTGKFKMPSTRLPPWVAKFRGKGGGVTAAAFSLWDAIAAFREGGLDGLVVAHLIKAGILGVATPTLLLGAGAAGGAVGGPVGSVAATLAMMVLLGQIDVHTSRLIEEIFNRSTIANQNETANALQRIISENLTTEKRRTIIIENHLQNGGPLIDRHEQDIVEQDMQGWRDEFRVRNEIGALGWN